MLHKILQRQLIKVFGSEEKIPQDLYSLFETISNTYVHADEDRNLIERSLEISSTELETLNSQLQSERDRAKAIILSMVDGLVVVKKDFTIELINPQAEKMLDLPEEKNVGVNWFDISTLLVHDQVVPIKDRFITKTIHTGQTFRSNLEDDYYLLTLLKNKIPVAITTTPLLLPNSTEVYGAVIIFRDISKEKQQHEFIEKEVVKRTQELSAEKNKLSLILSGVVDAVIAVDRDRRIILFNKAAENLTGYTMPEVFGKSLETVIRIVENATDIAAEVYCPVRSDNYEGISYHNEGLKLISSNGKQTFVNLLAGQITEGTYVNLGCILTLHDVSEERQLDEMKLDFVSMAAHELRTPLTSIKGYMYILLRDYKDIFNQEQMTILSRIDIASQRLASLVENLLNVTRIEKGQITLNMELIDWVKNIDEVITEIIVQAQDKMIQLEFIKPNESIYVKVDKFRINEVMMNLLANAINYTSPKGKITVWLEKVGEEVITHIKDTGEGIPKEAIPHLFTKFFRVSGVLEQGSKGTGLGLYIAKSIVEIHKGKIWVESKLGQGSTFSFSLLLAKDARNE